MGKAKSKLPDFKELTSMAGKFFGDMKNSFCGIMKDYKQKRTTTKTTTTAKEPKKEATVTKLKVAKKPAAKKTTRAKSAE